MAKGKGGGNRKGKGRDVREKAKDVMAMHFPESDAEEMIHIIEEVAREEGYTDAIGTVAAVVERDIRALRAKNHVTAELVSAIISSPLATFTEICTGLNISPQAARSRLWSAAHRIPWLELLLLRRMEYRRGRGGIGSSGGGKV